MLVALVQQMAWLYTEETNLSVVPVELELKLLITIDAVPDLAAVVVLCHVTPPSGFSTAQPAGGKVAFSKPSVIGSVTFPTTKKDLCSVSFNGDSSPVPEEDVGAEVYTVIW